MAVSSVRLVVGLLALGAVLAGLAGYDRARTGTAAEPVDPAKEKEPTIGTMPLFHGWPQAAPEAVVVLSGQTGGYLQPCGCSYPQLGGLERRANFMNALRAKGWPVVGVDLGDVVAFKRPIPDQAMLKYVTAMKAMRDMGYVATGFGRLEFDADLWPVLAQYALQTTDPPQILAGNMVGAEKQNGKVVKVIPREQHFPRGDGKPPMVGLEVVAPVGKTAVGVAGVVAPSLAKVAEKSDPTIGFLGNNVVLPQALAAMAKHPANPPVRFLIYQGTPEEPEPGQPRQTVLDEAKKVAEQFPEFNVILCHSDDPEPPQFPTLHAGPKHAPGQKTMLVQVGHKGRHVGVVAAFRTPAGLELRYQLVPLSPYYATPLDPAAEQANNVLQLLEGYAREVKQRDFLTKYPRTPHPAQIAAPQANLQFVGSKACQTCHPAEYAKWDQSKHGHAMDALEKVAKRPGLRNLDADCVRCHTVGFENETGYRDEKTTAHLRHVGCESCHGPGSGHVGQPRNPEFLKLLSPWKQNPPDKLPSPADMAKLAARKPGDPEPVQLTEGQRIALNRAQGMCMHCHDAENDPHFDLFKYWPKIDHTGLANGGLPNARLPAKK